MSVNTMTTEQAYALINAVHQQATGQNDIQAIDPASFVSVAQATLRCGYDEVMGAISQVLSRTIMSVRPYSRKFRGLEFTADRWGAITRKINFIEGEVEEDNTYNLVDGTSIDQFVIDKPKVLETHYYGKFVFKDKYTVFTRQLDVAFNSPSEFASFMGAVAEHFSNMWEQWLENQSRINLVNFIAGKINAGHVIYLLDEYNTATGLSLTPTTVRTPANYPGFMKFAYARVSEISRLFAERSQLFQSVISDKPIMRHTPLQDQRLYMLSNFLESMRAEVLADTYNMNLLNYDNTTESVSYWQAIESPDEINLSKFVTIDASGNYSEVSEGLEASNIIGVMFDRDALGYNIYQNEIVASPYNASAQYYNLFHHASMRLEADQTEKGVVFALTQA